MGSIDPYQLFRIFHERLGEVRVEDAILFNGPDVGARFEQCSGKRAESGAYFDHCVARRDAGKFERLADDVAIDEKILPEEPLWLVAE